MFKHLVNAPYVLNVLVPADIFFLIHFSGNLPSEFTSLGHDYSIHLKLNAPGPFEHNELLICRLSSPKTVLSSCSAFWGMGRCQARWLHAIQSISWEPQCGVGQVSSRSNQLSTLEAQWSDKRRTKLRTNKTKGKKSQRLKKLRGGKKEQRTKANKKHNSI